MQRATGFSPIQSPYDNLRRRDALNASSNASPNASPNAPPASPASLVFSHNSHISPFQKNILSRLKIQRIFFLFLQPNYHIKEKTI